MTAAGGVDVESMVGSVLWPGGSIALLALCLKNRPAWRSFGHQRFFVATLRG